MTTNKRITDLTDYTSVLPYASEMFGVYQPMIGWRSALRMNRFKIGLGETRDGLLRALASHYAGQVQSSFSTTDCVLDLSRISTGQLQGPQLTNDESSVLMQAIAATLPPDRMPADSDWQNIINSDLLTKHLTGDVARHYADDYQVQCRQLHERNVQTYARALSGTFAEVQSIEQQLVRNQKAKINYESALAGALLALVDNKQFAELRSLFYTTPTVDPKLATSQISQLLSADDPFATFDPNRDISQVSLSPLGIVHLFREYFFELDTFLGTPTAHV